MEEARQAQLAQEEEQLLAEKQRQASIQLDMLFAATMASLQALAGKTAQQLQPLNRSGPIMPSPWPDDAFADTARCKRSAHSRSAHSSRRRSMPKKDAVPSRLLSSQYEPEGFDALADPNDGQVVYADKPRPRLPWEIAGASPTMAPAQRLRPPYAAATATVLVPLLMTRLPA